MECRPTKIQVGLYDINYISYIAYYLLWILFHALLSIINILRCTKDAEKYDVCHNIWCSRFLHLHWKNVNLNCIANRKERNKGLLISSFTVEVWGDRGWGLGAAHTFPSNASIAPYVFLEWCLISVQINLFLFSTKLNGYPSNAKMKGFTLYYFAGQTIPSVSISGSFSGSSDTSTWNSHVRSTSGFGCTILKVKATPLEDWTGRECSWGFQDVEAPRFLDKRHMKVVRK